MIDMIDDRYDYALQIEFIGIYFLHYFATRDINTNITLPWIHTQLATQDHTLSYIYMVGTAHNE